MSADFDIAAEVYDKTFTHTIIGRIQRDRVWTYSQKNLSFEHPLRILELNCGTGEDALFFAKAGHQVIATDISKKMVDICHFKIKKAELEQQVTVQQLDMKELSSMVFPEKFDLIFSNFGGLNCLAPEELKQVMTASKKHLKTDGKFIAVIMPDFCLMESLYFFLKLEFKKIFRRKTNTYVLANVDGVDVKTWYYSPNAMKKIIDDTWTKATIEPIGFLPSYLENALKKNVLFMKMILKMDAFLNWTRWSSASDHYIIDVRNSR